MEIAFNFHEQLALQKNNKSTKWFSFARTIKTVITKTVAEKSYAWPSLLKEKFFASCF